MKSFAIHSFQSSLVSIVAVFALTVPGAAFADDDDGPCTGFLVPPGSTVYADSSATAKVVERREGWLVALANPGFGGSYGGRVRIDVSDRIDLMAACYGKDFTVEKDFLRVWLEPERFEKAKGWVRLSELRTFEFPRPEKWTAQDVGVNMTRILRASDVANRTGTTGKLQAKAQPTSETFGATPDAVWFAALEGVLKAGWKVERADRSGGVITAKDRRLSAAEATTCSYMTGETESFGLSVLVAPTASGARVTAVLAFDDDDLTEKKCVTSGAVEQKVLAAIREAVAGSGTR